MPDSAVVIPDLPFVIPDLPFVIPDLPFVIPAPDQVRGFNIRDPVPRQYWIAGRGPQ